MLRNAAGNAFQNRCHPGAARTRTPMVRIFGCCASEARGHAIAATATDAMKSRRLIASPQGSGPSIYEAYLAHGDRQVECLPYVADGSIAPNTARVLRRRMSVAPRKRQSAAKMRPVVKGQITSLRTAKRKRAFRRRRRTTLWHFDRERAPSTTSIGDIGSTAHTIVIWCLSSLAKMLFGMRAWTPRTMSTTCVTRKLTAILQRA